MGPVLLDKLGLMSPSCGTESSFSVPVTDSGYQEKLLYASLSVDPFGLRNTDLLISVI